jgi:hypothetical protein
MTFSRSLIHLSLSSRRWAGVACPGLFSAVLISLALVACGSENRCELTATCPADQDSGVLGEDDVSDDLSNPVSNPVSDDSSDNSDDGPTPSPGPTSGSADAGAAPVSNTPGGSLTILPPGPPAPADCTDPNCPSDAGMPGPNTGDASAVDTVDGSIAECVGAICDGGVCQGDDCETGCTPGVFDSTNFDDACFQ